jgi:glycerol-3-phosphate dehydrogenase (NAD(P)+)
VLRQVAGRAAPAVGKGAILVVATKGIERDSLAIMTRVAEEELPGRAVVALSGPSFAAEVATHQPTAIVAASTDATAAERAQLAFSSPEFRVYTNDDVVGVELGGALKNVVAIAAGAVAGRGLGENARAALVTRGLAEMARLGEALGARRETLMGLSGLGDLLLTATSPTSRNYRFGQELGRGRSPRELLAPGAALSEGAFTAEAACRLAATVGVELPVADAVRRVLAGDLTVDAAVELLLARRPAARE